MHATFLVLQQRHPSCQPQRIIIHKHLKGNLWWYNFSLKGHAALNKCHRCKRIMLRKKLLYWLCIFHHIKSYLVSKKYHDTEPAGSNEGIISIILTSCSHLSIANSITGFVNDFRCPNYNDNKNFLVVVFFTCTKPKAHIHRHQENQTTNMDVIVQLGLELTDAKADYSAFSGHMTSGLHAMLFKGATSGMLLID